MGGCESSPGQKKGRGPEGPRPSAAGREAARLVDRVILNAGGGAGIDLDGARLLALGQFALQLQMQQPVFEAGAMNLDIIGKLEAQLEGALGNAAMEEF